ncbi:hypothetical protein [Crateriforma spongiae]
MALIAKENRKAIATEAWRQIGNNGDMARASNDSGMRISGDDFDRE